MSDGYYMWMNLVPHLQPVDDAIFPYLFTAV